VTVSENAPRGVMPTAVPLDRIEAAEHRQLLETLRAGRHTFPGVDLEAKPVCDRPGRALIEESAGAGLVVVGSRGHGGFAGLLLGSVSQSVPEHTPEHS
jgi:nucleotide-binding universal stress UspA family protein